MPFGVDATTSDNFLSSGFINFGCHSLASGKNEDRASMFVTHKEDGLPFVATFSVFDGHNGKSTADICSQIFNRNVVRRVKAWSAVSPSRESKLLPEEMTDAIICESFRASCEEVDSAVKKRNYQSGATLNSLLLSCNKETGRISAYCANVGDSR
jgi:serine/threonine protein phosphatase PrpC